MKLMIIAASAAAALCAAAPAFAQDASTSPLSNVYGTLGYANAHTNGTNLGAIEGRLGYRFTRYLGAEGDLAFGVNHDDQAGVDFKLKNSYAGYAVGFLPISPRADLFARVGYGHSSLDAKTTTAPITSVTTGEDSFNFGAGGQYFLDSANGVRLDFTRYDFSHNNGHSNVAAVSYVRKF